MENLNDILKLSIAERILVMERIWDSIEREKIEVTPFQKKELDKRLKRYQEGKTKFYSWQEVKGDIQKALKDVSNNNI